MITCICRQCGKKFKAAYKNKLYCGDYCKAKTKELRKIENRKPIVLPRKYLVRGKIHMRGYSGTF